MTDDEHKAAVVEELKKEMLYDRTKTRVIGMSALGLVEITRKKVGRELSTVLLDECPYCGGDAHAQSVDYVARKIKAELKRLFADGKMKTAVVRMNPSLIEAMFKGKYFTADCETIWISVFTLFPMPKCLTAASPSRVARTPPSSYLQRQNFFIDVMKK